MKNDAMKKVLPLVLVAAVFGGGGFYGGMSYQKTKAAASASAQGGFGDGQGFRGAGGRGQGFRGAGGFVGGDVLSKDDKSITIKLRNGGSQTVYYSTATTVSKPSPVAMDSLNVGDSVMVSGKPNSDGSVTADAIQIRPPMPAGQSGGAPAPAPQNTNQ